MPSASDSIKAYATAQKAFNDRDNAAVTALQAKFQALSDLIDQLQNTPGPISTEDQATLDDLQAQAASFTDSLEAIAATTPPPVPVV